MKALVGGWWFHLSFGFLSMVDNSTDHGKFLSICEVHIFKALFFFYPVSRERSFKPLLTAVSKNVVSVSCIRADSLLSCRGGWTRPSRYHGSNYRIARRWSHLPRTCEEYGFPVFPNVSSKKRWIALDCLFFPSFCLVSVLYSQKWQSVILSAGFIRTIYRRLESSRW